MKRNANFPILIVVIALVAVVAQWTRHSAEKPEWTSLRQDLEASLARLWNRPQQEVEFVAGHSGVSVPALVNLPPGLPPRQQRWNYPFLRFVALRHPAVSVEQLEVVDAGNHQKISEIAMHGLLAEAAYAPRQDEERTCAMVGRQLTAALEKQLGRGEVLVLVDARRTSSKSDDGSRYGKVVRYPQPAFQVLQYEICVVFRSPMPEDKWKQFATSHLDKGESIRKVTLP